MDDMVARALTKQLKIFNLWLNIIGISLLVGFIIIGILLYKVITFTHHLSGDVNGLQSKTERSIQQHNPF